MINLKIDLFVMVTATYAKPKLAYSTLIENKDPILIEWSYNDQQKMKDITNPIIKEEFIDSRKKKIKEQEVIKKIFHEYIEKYGKEYLNILQENYNKYPELVIIQPYISLQKKNTLQFT